MGARRLAQLRDEPRVIVHGDNRRFGRPRQVERLGARPAADVQGSPRARQGGKGVRGIYATRTIQRRAYSGRSTKSRRNTCPSPFPRATRRCRGEARSGSRAWPDGLVGFSHPTVEAPVE